MKKVILKCNSPRLVDYILVNGESVRFKKVKGTVATFIYEFETDKDEFRLNLDPFHPYLQDNWWTKMMVLKLISLYGIFDSHYMPKYVYHYDGVVSLKEDVTELRVNAGGYQHKALLVEGNASVTENENSLEADKRIKKRKGLLVLTKVLLILATLGALTAVVILTLK